MICLVTTTNRNSNRNSAVGKKLLSYLTQSKAKAKTKGEFTFMENYSVLYGYGYGYLESNASGPSRMLRKLGSAHSELQ
jgi:hypothetical protein